MIGLHVQFAKPEAMDYLYKASPSLLKWMDWDRVYLLKQYCNWFKNKYGFKPTIIARDYNIRFLEHLSAIECIKHLQAIAGDVIDYYELTNELACTDAAALKQLNQFSILVMNALPTVKFLLGSIAEGNPPIIADIVELAPALRIAKAAGGGLALHEYSQPTMLTDATWHCGRFIRIIAALPADLKDIIIYVTECGIDGSAQVEMFPIKFGRGWRSYTTEVPLLNQVGWYNTLMETNKIRGGTLFDVGTDDSFTDFELIGTEQIAKYVAGQRKEAPVLAKKLYLAICPSNQDQNTFAQTNERVQMALFASRMLAICRTMPQVVAKVFLGEPQSLDRDKGYLFGLKKQLNNAAEWLRAQADGVKVCLNVHTDSGTWSHIGYYWWDQGHSRMLGDAIADKVQPVFGLSTRVTNWDYSSYYFVRLTKDCCTPLLLELGSHQNAHDVAVMRDCGYLVARPIVNTMLDYFKQYLT